MVDGLEAWVDGRWARGMGSGTATFDDMAAGYLRYAGLSISDMLGYPSLMGWACVRMFLVMVLSLSHHYCVHAQSPNQ